MSTVSRKSKRNARLDWSSALRRGAHMSLREATDVESRLVETEDDLTARLLLLGYYLAHEGEETAAEAYGRHHAWLVLHMPSNYKLHSEISYWCPLRARDQVKRAWLSAAAAQGAPALFRSASEFFEQVGETVLAEEMLRRGQSMQPGRAEWRLLLGGYYLRMAECAAVDERQSISRAALHEFDAVLTLGVPQIWYYAMLIDVSKAAFLAGDYGRANAIACELLVSARRQDGMWDLGNRIHAGHIILGRVALVEGDLEGAREHLIEAGMAPGSPQLNSFGPDFSLANALLEHGECSAVLGFLNGCKRFWLGGEDLIDHWIDAILRGEQPLLDRAQ